MDERLVQFRVGVMVLATAIITIILILLFGEFPSLASNNYPVTMFFEEAPGVMKDTPVRKNGLLIGRVTEVELDEQRRGVVVTANIDGARRLYKNEIPRINGSLLGDATIEFMLGRNVRPEAQHELITSTDTLVGEVAPSPMEAFGDLQRRLDDAFVILEQTSRNIDETSATIRETAKTFTSAGNQFAEVGQRINAILGSDVDGDVRTMLKKAEATIDALYTAIQDADLMIKDVRILTSDPKIQENIRRTVSELPETIAQGRETLEAGAAVFQDARAVVANAATTVQALERNLKNLEGFTEPLGRHGAEIVNVVRLGTGQIGTVMDQVAIFTRSLNSSEGTVGKLLNDPDLYLKVNLIADRVNGLLRDARPVLDDVRVITDKVARRGVGEVLRSAVRPDTLK